MVRRSNAADFSLVSGLVQKTGYPYHCRDLISNSPYSFPVNSYEATSKNLVLDQLIIPQLIFFFILIITCLLHIVRRISVLATL